MSDKSFSFDSVEVRPLVKRVYSFQGKVVCEEVGEATDTEYKNMHNTEMSK